MNRAIVVWLVVMVNVAVGMIIWYVTQPAVQVLADTMLSAARDMGTNTTTVERGFTVIELINVIWILLYIVAWIVFGFLFGSRREGEGQYVHTTRF